MKAFQYLETYLERELIWKGSVQWYPLLFSTFEN